MAEPVHIAKVLDEADLFKKMEKANPELAEKCREAFREGRDEQRRRSETGSSRTTNTSSNADTESRRRSGLPDMAILIPVDSPVRISAESPDLFPVILRIGQTTGHVVAKDRLNLIAAALKKAGWTLAELELAESLILTDAALMKEISYERTVGPGVFAQAKSRSEVMRGRLFTYQEANDYSRSQMPKGRENEAKPVSQLFEAARFKEDPKEVRWILK